MSENLPDTNVGNIEYIERQAAIDTLAEQIALCDKALKSFGISMKDEYAVKVERASLIAYKEQLDAITAADVVPYSIDPDGTLTVTVPKGTKRIGRILIEEDGTQYGGLFYPDTGGCFLSSMERSEQDGQKDNHRCIKALCE